MNKKFSLRNPLLILPLAVFVTNIGNGMYTLAVSKVMYDVTKSTTAFASVLILENILIFMTQAIASITVDNGRAKQSAFFADLIRGISIIISGILIIMGYPMVIFFGTIVLNLMRPFYRTATFAIGPLIAQGDELAKYNSKVSVLQQVGQLVGAGIAGFFMLYFSEGICIMFNGMTYVFSATCIAIVNIANQSIFTKEGKGVYEIISMIKPKKFYNEWFDLVKELIKKKELIGIVLICTIDYNIISYINMAYAPTLDRINESTIWLSFWDGFFAIGAIVGAIIFGRSKKVRESLNYVAVILILEGILAINFTFNNPILITIFMFGLGITNAVSVSTFSYNLQIRCNKEFHGRISGIRQLTISTTSLIIVPILSFLMNKNMLYSSIFLLGICVLGGIITWSKIGIKKIVI